MKRLNKKGFTLIELLAVIVVLAIIMVIATQQVNKTISKSRANSYIESYQMIVKQVKTFIASDDTESIACATADDCKETYELSDDYDITITDVDSVVTINYGAATDGKFKNVDLTKYGDAAKDGTPKTCDATKIGSNAKSCTKNTITGELKY